MCLKEIKIRLVHVTLLVYLVEIQALLCREFLGIQPPRFKESLTGTQGSDLAHTPVLDTPIIPVLGILG